MKAFILLLLGFTLASRSHLEYADPDQKELCAQRKHTQFPEKYFRLIFLLLVTYSLIFRLPECCLSPQFLFTPYFKLISLSL